MSPPIKHLLLNASAFLLILFQHFTFATAEAIGTTAPDWLIGNWHFIGYIYQGNFRPPLNPNLNIIFRFESDGTDYLFWNRQAENGFCERRGQFSVENGALNDEVLWTNPNNFVDCSQDPDMQIGKKTSTPIVLVNGQIQLNLGLAGDPFFYVFEPIPKNPYPPN